MLVPTAASSSGAGMRSPVPSPNFGTRRVYKDERKAVVRRQIDSPPLTHLPDPIGKLPKLPSSMSGGRMTPPASRTFSASAPEGGTPPASSSPRCGCLDGLWTFLRGSPVQSDDRAGRINQTPEGKEAPRRWYRVHPITDELYYVRPDAGLAGRTEGHPDAGKLRHRDSLSEMLLDNDLENTDPVKSQFKRCLHRKNSVPSEVLRYVGMNVKMDDTFANQCKLCYDKRADIVLLPCRHGGMCEECLRRSLFIRPPNQGGNSCPYCRKRIIEVIKMYGDSTINQYGYAISAGCFFLGKDDNA